MSSAPNGRPPELFYYDGKRLSLSDWAKLKGVPIEILRGRLGGRSRLTLEEALTQPLTRATKVKAERSYTATGLYSIEKAFRDWVSSPAPCLS